MNATLHDPPTVRRIEPRYADIYAHAVETRLGPARQLHVSGQLGIDREGHLAPTFEGQARRAMANIEAILEAAEMTTADLVRVRYYLTDPAQVEALSAIRSEKWGGVRPAVTTLVVAGLVRPEYLIEIEVLAQADGS